MTEQPNTPTDPDTNPGQSMMIRTNMILMLAAAVAVPTFYMANFSYDLLMFGDAKGSDFAYWLVVMMGLPMPLVLIGSNGMALYLLRTGKIGKSAMRLPWLPAAWGIAWFVALQGFTIS